MMVSDYDSDRVDNGENDDSDGENDENNNDYDDDNEGCDIDDETKKTTYHREGQFYQNTSCRSNQILFRNHPHTQDSRHNKSQ